MVEPPRSDQWPSIPLDRNTPTEGPKEIPKARRRVGKRAADGWSLLVGGFGAGGVVQQSIG